MTDAGKAKAMKAFQALWRGDPAVKLVKVDAVQYLVSGEPGHPFCIGPAHVAHASDHCSGMLGEETMRAIPCKAGPKESRELLTTCNKPYGAHTTEWGLFVELMRDVDEKKLSGWLSALKPEMRLRGISGFAFLGTKSFAVLRDGVPMMGRGK